jgi:hypothetical protein
MKASRIKKTGRQSRVYYDPLKVFDDSLQRSKDPFKKIAESIREITIPSRFLMSPSE